MSEPVDRLDCELAAHDVWLMLYGSLHLLEDALEQMGNRFPFSAKIESACAILKMTEEKARDIPGLFFKVKDDDQGPSASA